MTKRFSSAYIAALERGPFPDQIDPWAEVGRYYKQIHAGMIEHLVEQIKIPLLEMGYIAGRETSLTIAKQQFEPDIHIDRQINDIATPPPRWNYAAAAALLETAPGVLINLDETPQDALVIRAMESDLLVTIVEFISPSNKTDPEDMRRYRERRAKLLAHQINIVEIDLTRSYTRLLNHASVQEHPYHALVYLPHDDPYYFGVAYGERLMRLALPLRGEALPVELHSVYQTAYQVMTIAAQILNRGHYQEDKLPFPTTLTPTQRQGALDKVAAWQAELAALRQNPG